MISVLLRTFALFSLGLAACSWADEKPVMHNRVIKIPASLFHQPLNLPTGEPLASLLHILPSTPDGEGRTDVLDYLERFGVEKKPGNSAIALERSKLVVVRAPLETLDLAERILASCCSEGPIKQVEISARLWEYEDDPFLDPIKRPRTVADLQARGGDSLRLLDAISVLTKSGQRVTGQNGKETAPSTKTNEPSKSESTVFKPTGTATADVSGSSLEVEPNIGPDGQAIDFQLNYHLRLLRGKDEPDLVQQIDTNGTIVDGKEVVTFTTTDPSTPSAKVRIRALTVGMRLLDTEGGLSQSPIENRIANDEKIIHRAQAGIVPGIN